MAKLGLEDASLEGEAQEIEVTLKTLSRVYGIELANQPEMRAVKNSGATSTKPNDAPTLFEMVAVVLKDWALLDDHIEGQFIYDEIKKRWWPDAPRNSIIPSLWRFANEGRLVKEGTKYGLPQKEETSDAGTSDVSSFRGDLDDEIPF